MSALTLTIRTSWSCHCGSVVSRPRQDTFRTFTRPILRSRYRYRVCRQPAVNMHQLAENGNGGRTQLFRLSDYDCVGFDLDNTILRYNINHIIKLEYDALAEFLVKDRGYGAQFLQQPLRETEIDFLQKGLVLDYENGNVLQLAPDGSIQRASHGTKFLGDEELEKMYGKDRCSALTREFSQNILGVWNGPMSEKIRACLDYFDVPISLAFARCVDSIDANAKETAQLVERYDLYNDITAGLMSMYAYQNFRKSAGSYFRELKNNPDQCFHKCSPNVLNWLKELKKNKITFLITGSYMDFASFTAEYCLGENWQSLFDIVIFQARKPGFFTAARPFLKCINADSEETEVVDELKFGYNYIQGNWQALYELFKQKTSLSNPKCVYFGDNVVQDVYAVDKSTCDAVAISEEMLGNEIQGLKSDTEKIISSNAWGSYFVDSKNGSGSFWGDMIQKHATVCIPNLDALADKPLDFQIQGFGCKSPDLSQPFGYFPKSPF